VNIGPPLVARSALPSRLLLYKGSMHFSVRNLPRLLFIFSNALLCLLAPGKALGQTNELGCGVHKDALRAIYARSRSDEHADLKGIVILCNGRRVSEVYFNGDSAESLHDIRSATKSITATLMGIAVQQGFVHSVDDSIALYLPGLPHDGKQNITIRDLLTMRSGLSANDDDPLSPGNEDNLDKSSDWLKAAYAVPVKEQAGRTYVYCSLNAFLAGVIVAKAAGLPLDEFARKNLFMPLGIQRFAWLKAAGGQTKGQGNLFIRARDLAAIGQLYLDRGVFRQKRVLKSAWIEKSWAAQVSISSSDPYADFYGYMWYSRDEPTRAGVTPVHFASGNGGNKVYVVPSRHLVIAITSSAYGHGYGQRRSQNILLSILSNANPS
jgi:CubicO group peptidase (beta-lactamase class C family)